MVSYKTPTMDMTADTTQVYLEAVVNTLTSLLHILQNDTDGFDPTKLAFTFETVVNHATYQGVFRQSSEVGQMERLKDMLADYYRGEFDAETAMLIVSFIVLGSNGVTHLHGGDLSRDFNPVRFLELIVKYKNANKG